MGEAPEVLYVNGSSKVVPETQQNHVNNVVGSDTWYEEVIDDDLKWSFKLNSVLHKAISEYQDIALLDTKRFGKALVLDGKMQSAEADEFIYHECLIHPPLLCHPK
ncbi:thermospermine synthase ACAULIS5-like protein [Trifolium pratense]|uniref:Thermospermine synthase ACAULIS5-like protein n=1 Tax=Trifolium pratense TaxID=57577 RepID=A0A2K3MEJ7_TRIPR|nr:thermospermine synthase ACAULIS5-like protein [Trifolium pratense]